MREQFVGFRASGELIRAVDEAAKHEGRTRSGMIKRILGGYFEARNDIEAGKTQVDMDALAINGEAK